MNIKKMKNLSKILIVLILAAIFFSTSALAQTPTEIQSSPSITLTNAPTPTPVGQVISLDFKMPGIGGEDENLSPLRTTRNVMLYFFNPEINTEDLSSRPISSFAATVTYDSDTVSPTYGSFVNTQIDLGNEVEDGKYQIVIKADQALSKLVKSGDGESLGGEIYEIGSSYSRKIEISGLSLIVGDIYPEPKGDNVMDINDYNSLVNCFGAKSDTEDCPDKTAADLGLPVPTFIPQSPTPTPTVTKPTIKPTIVSTPTPAVAQSSSPVAGIVLVSVITLIILIGIALMIFKRKKLKSFIQVLMHKQSKDAGEVESTEKGEAEAGENEFEKEVFVKKQTYDDVNKTAVLTLTDDSGPMLGYYSGGEVVDGFAKVKGVMKKEGDKVFIDVSEITPIDQSA
jgi:uncharacterized protein YxeA